MSYLSSTLEDCLELLTKAEGQTDFGTEHAEGQSYARRQQQQCEAAALINGIVDLIEFRKLPRRLGLPLALSACCVLATRGNRHSCELLRLLNQSQYKPTSCYRFSSQPGQLNAILCAAIGCGNAQLMQQLLEINTKHVGVTCVNNMFAEEAVAKAAESSSSTEFVEACYEAATSASINNDVYNPIAVFEAVLRGPMPQAGVENQAQKCHGSFLSNRDYAAAAASSPRCRWVSGVRYAEQLPFSLPRSQSQACSAAARADDARERITWLQELGYRLEHSSALVEAARYGRSEAVAYIATQAAEATATSTTSAPLIPPVAVESAWRLAAEGGHLPVLEVLRRDLDRSMAFAPPALWSAAAAGQGRATEWLLGALPLPPSQLLHEALFAAAPSGNQAFFAKLLCRSSDLHRTPQGLLTLLVASAGCPASLRLLQLHGMLAWPQGDVRHSTPAAAAAAAASTAAAAAWSAAAASATAAADVFSTASAPTAAAAAALSAAAASATAAVGAFSTASASTAAAAGAFSTAAASAAAAAGAFSAAAAAVANAAAAAEAMSASTASAAAAAAAAAAAHRVSAPAAATTLLSTSRLWRLTFERGDLLTLKALKRLSCPMTAGLLEELAALAPDCDRMIPALAWAFGDRGLWERFGVNTTRVLDRLRQRTEQFEREMATEAYDELQHRRKWRSVNDDAVASLLKRLCIVQYAKRGAAGMPQ